MQIAILSVASLSLVVSVGTLLIMAKTAHELHEAKAEVDTNVEAIKDKVNYNAKVVKTALAQLEF